jgi:glutamate---cysteine ligase / carboxylate-amine ligase
MSDATVYSIGIEEEFFVYEQRTRRAASRGNARFFAAAKDRLGDAVMPEMLQSQIEVVTPPCATMAEVRRHLAHYRRVLGEQAEKYGLGIAATGTFPLAFWREQAATPKARYRRLMADLQAVGQRNMFCGMHVHVAIEDPDSRIALMRRIIPYVPLLQVLSTSSPFWQGRPTGLRGYRLTAYGELPRTGLPELFRTKAEYDDYVAALVSAGIIPDASHIWWSLRPSLANPTLELRACDTCTRLDDAIAIAALYRCLVRAHDRDRELNAGFDRVGRAITSENKWRAERHGVAATFVDPFSRRAMTAGDWLAEVMTLIASDAAALHCEAEIADLPRIIAEGTSADAQIRIYETAHAESPHRRSALAQVVDWAGRQTVAAGAVP